MSDPRSVAVAPVLLAGRTGRYDRASKPQRVYESRALFDGGHELLIEHNGEMYTLRLTSKGKLILTK